MLTESKTTDEIRAFNADLERDERKTSRPHAASTNGKQSTGTSSLMAAFGMAPKQ